MTRHAASLPVIHHSFVVIIIRRWCSPPPTSTQWGTVGKLQCAQTGWLSGLSPTPTPSHTSPFVKVRAHMRTRPPPSQPASLPACQPASHDSDPRTHAQQRTPVTQSREWSSLPTTDYLLTCFLPTCGCGCCGRGRGSGSCQPTGKNARRNAAVVCRNAAVVCRATPYSPLPHSGVENTRTTCTLLRCSANRINNLAARTSIDPPQASLDASTRDCLCQYRVHVACTVARKRASKCLCYTMDTFRKLVLVLVTVQCGRRATVQTQVCAETSAVCTTAVGCKTVLNKWHVLKATHQRGT